MRHRPWKIGIAATAMAIALFGYGASQAAPGDAPAAAHGTFTLALGGDLLGNLSDSPAAPETQRIWDLYEHADAGFANLEGGLFDLRSFPGYAASENGTSNNYGDAGGGPVHPVAMAAMLRDHGVTLISLANNHGLDWDAEGLNETIQNLGAAQLTFAGGGEDLAAARRPAVRQTPHGKVALVSAAATYQPQAVAGPPGRLPRGRPGISALRISPIIGVNRAEFASISAIAERMGQVVPAGAHDIQIYTTANLLYGMHFRLSEHPGLDYSANEADRSDILAQIKAARAESDYVVLSVHAHESASGASDSRKPVEPGAEPPAYLRAFYHDIVDAGADVAVTHGPHVLRGIEIYKGKPIFYGTGSLLYGLGLEIRGYQLPQEWDESFVAVAEMNAGRVSRIRLYPIVHFLGAAPDAKDKSQPRLATGEEAQRILTYLQRQSEPYGTRIRIEGGVGIIDLSGA